jgi:hypothetical protein
MSRTLQAAAGSCHPHLALESRYGRHGWTMASGPPQVIEQEATPVSMPEGPSSGAVDWSQVADLVEESYRLTAPKRLLALLGP